MSFLNEGFEEEIALLTQQRDDAMALVNDQHNAVLAAMKQLSESNEVMRSASATMRKQTRMLNAALAWLDVNVPAVADDVRKAGEESAP
jgi:hypothetical protein